MTKPAPTKDFKKHIESQLEYARWFRPSPGARADGERFLFETLARTLEEAAHRIRERQIDDGGEAIEDVINVIETLKRELV